MDIRQANLNDADSIVKLIRNSYKKVADRLGITEEKNPKAVSFYTKQRFIEDVEKGEVFYLLEIDGQVCGCVAMEKGDEGIVNLRRLAVLPEHCRLGYGKTLVEHVFKEAGKQGFECVEIWTASEDKNLVNWYKKLGFVSQGTRKCDYLPCTFELMFKELQQR